MLVLLPSTSALVGFLAASLALAVIPGPAVLYIVTRSATQGRASGLASVAGVAAGNLGSAIAAAIGLAAILAVSRPAFLVLKYAGAGYLVYLGVRTICTSSTGKQKAAPQLTTTSLSRTFCAGFLVALFNPKTALFFAAFLPQFLPGTAHPWQIVVLGATFVAIAAMTDTCYALASSAIRPLWSGRASNDAWRFTRGGVFIGLGVVAALTGHRAKA